MSIAKRFAELALARFQKKEPETPTEQWNQACDNVIAQMMEGLPEKLVINPKAYDELEEHMASDEDYQRSLRDD